jgi:hypothetical protein
MVGAGLRLATDETVMKASAVQAIKWGEVTAFATLLLIA